MKCNARIQKVVKRMNQAVRYTGDWFAITQKRPGRPWSNITGEDIYLLMVYERGEPSSAEEEKQWREQANQIWSFLINTKRAEENNSRVQESWEVSLNTAQEMERDGEELV